MQAHHLVDLVARWTWVLALHRSTLAVMLHLCLGRAGHVDRAGSLSKKRGGEPKLVVTPRSLLVNRLDGAPLVV